MTQARNKRNLVMGLSCLAAALALSYASRYSPNLAMPEGILSAMVGLLLVGFFVFFALLGILPRGVTMFSRHPLWRTGNDRQQKAGTLTGYAEERERRIIQRYRKLGLIIED